MVEKSERAQREEKILQFWKENKIFEKTLEKDSPKGEFVFYEGPPTANAKPAIHHLEARAFKDAIPRYKTMRGFHVPRKAGWDTHGLPVELEVEKTLDLKSKKEIEEYGIAKFNKECRTSVQKYVNDWVKFTDRIGYWVNLNDAYFTYDSAYIEAVWSILAHVEKRKLLYKDYKVVPWCPRCGTVLSSHELAQGYKDVKDLSIYAKFKVVGEENTYFLAWTTTPWTLPGNLALAVGEKVDYVKIKVGEENFILAESRLSIVDVEYEVVKKLKGKNIVGTLYEPLYPFLKDKSEKSFKVYPADFVNIEDGTGIVHTAVMYGQDDFELGTKIGLPKYHLVDESGHFKAETGFLAGRFVRDEETAVEIIKDLAHRSLLFKKEKYEHSYPHCWRCKTSLIYYARDSWYIAMSRLRDKLVKTNEKINWEPEHIRDGRFGEWLKEVKDWAISRERYWGTPLPLWQNPDGSKRIVVNSIETLKKYTKTSSNKYFLMRHGEAENNVKRVVSVNLNTPHHLTDFGRKQVESAVNKLLSKNIDIIISSPLIRARETAELVSKILKLGSESIVFDERLREFGAGEFDGRDENEIRDYFGKHKMFLEGVPGGENFNETKRRLGETLKDLEKKYQGKTILIITHKVCCWLISAAAKRLDSLEAEKLSIYLNNGEIIDLDTPVLPHNEDFELDLHRPYIDEIVLVKNDEEYKRVKEVLDVWFDSGSMPFAQDPKNILYPADFISEAIDQTRGWFYTLHAVGALMEKGMAYKNVICLGHLLDKDGKKMSKSIGNVVNPWEEIEKYGVDTLRFWMYSVNQPGESKNFDSLTVAEINRRVFNILDNIYAFYDLYRDKKLETEKFEIQNDSVLDVWILTRAEQLTKKMTNYLDSYKLLEPVRDLRDFIDDLSTWYLRRSREKIKLGDINAKRRLFFMLRRVATLLAPFAPFVAEDLYQKLRHDWEPESIHLTNWPDANEPPKSEEILNSMREVRRIVSEVLMARNNEGIKVRQPLQLLKVQDDKLKNKNELIELIKEEINVKEIIFDRNMTQGFELDINLTPELIEEGKIRDAIRFIQDMRKEKSLNPKDLMQFSPQLEEKEFFKRNLKEIEKATNIKIEI